MPGRRRRLEPRRHAGGPAKQLFGFADYTDQMDNWFAELAGRSRRDQRLTPGSDAEWWRS